MRRGVRKLKMDPRTPAIVLLPLLLALALYVKVTGEERRASHLRRQLSEMQELMKGYEEADSEMEAYRKRVFLKEEEVSVVLEEVLDGLHLKERLSSIRPTVQKEAGKYLVEGAEVKMERLTLNEAVNLLYAVERGQEGFILRSLTMKKDFSRPERLNVTFEVAVLKARDRRPIR